MLDTEIYFSNINVNKSIVILTEVYFILKIDWLIK